MVGCVVACQIVSVDIAVVIHGDDLYLVLTVTCYL